MPLSGRPPNVPNRQERVSRADTVAGVSKETPGFDGMTVNERLFASDLSGRFDAAIDDGDRQGAIALLTQVAMSQNSAGAAVDAILADPARYGYPRTS